VRFCRDAGHRPLPAQVSTVGAYVGCRADKGTCQPSSVASYLAPIRKRHLAGGYASPTAHHSVREALQGYTNEWLDAAGAAKPQRCAFPAPLAWRLARRAARAPDHRTFLRFTAVVTQFLWGRRARDALRLRVGDLRCLASGAVHCQNTRSKTDSRRPGGERLAHVYPPSPFTAPDYPVLNLRRLLAWHRRSGSPASAFLFAPFSSTSPGVTLSAWLRDGLAALNVAAPLGQRYCSHSCRAGFITSGRAAGLGLDAPAQFAGLSHDVLLGNYLEALAPSSTEAHLFFGRFLPPPVALPTRAAVLPLFWQAPLPGYALVLGRFSVVTCFTRRGRIWASPRRLPWKSIPPRDPVAAGWPAAGRVSPPIGDDGRLQVVARRPLLGGAPLPDTSAVSPRTLPSGGVHGSLFFRFPPSSLPNRFASLHICRFVFLFLVEAGFFSPLHFSLLFSRSPTK